jgi:hypothetical protein
MSRSDRLLSGLLMLLLATRVTRLGEFSPFGRLFTLGRFLKVARVAQIVWEFLSTAQVMHTFLQEMGWATFWAIFSQTHLVTLLATISQP